jgi:hypothetical protein
MILPPRRNNILSAGELKALQSSRGYPASIETFLSAGEL